jgi:lysophospholipase L1-like esterase
MLLNVIRRIKIVIAFILAIFIFATIFYLVNRFSYVNELPYFAASKNKSNFLTIGIIGDSWVSNNNLDNYLHELLLKKGLNNKIISSGNSSAKSKLIYQNIYKDSTEAFSSKSIINANPDYCIVVAGVNDAAGQLGAKFYAHHMHLIIKTLLHYNITPIVVELPEIGIIEYTNNTNLIYRLRYKLSAIFNNNGEIDNIKTYRKSLKDLLLRNKLLDKIIFVDYDKICPDYKNCKSLYKKDGLHLNTIGNKVLSETIVEKLIEEVKQDENSPNNITNK